MSSSKTKFIEALLLVSRLDEKNEYITGAVEILIERINPNDYRRFIAFLGERDSSFEKPMENIAKGVQEFIDLRELPTVERAKKMAEDVRVVFVSMKQYFADHAKWIEFLSYKKDNPIFVNATTEDGRVFSDEMIDIIFEVGLLPISKQMNKKFVDREPEGDMKHFHENVINSVVYQHMTRGLSKSVSDRVLIQASKKQELTLLELTKRAKMIGGTDD